MSVGELGLVLEAARFSEKEQALFYRGMAAAAESLGDAELAQRFHDLHADEQHHLSRLTARLLELGGRPRSLDDAVSPAAAELEGWAEVVRERENTEVARYRALLEYELDAETRALIDEILAVEIHHSTELGGKWTMA
jgi:rubrerythrin